MKVKKVYPVEREFLRNSKFLIGVTPKVAGGGGSDVSSRLGGAKSR